MLPKLIPKLMLQYKVLRTFLEVYLKEVIFVNRAKHVILARLVFLEKGSRFVSRERKLELLQKGGTSPKVVGHY